MSKQVRVNIRSAVNSAKIRREKINGRDCIVVPSATLPDNIVMNGVRYEAEEIEKSYLSLENTPAPLGHPTINGKFVSASDPEGLVRGWIGAFNRNVRRENGRVLIDKIIDVETANQLSGGRAVLEAIDKGEPIHTSTGLFALMEDVQNASDGAKRIARDIVFDHDAILLGEEGAATPEQGVGMLVNSAVGKDGEKIEVLNSSLDEAERELDWAVDMAARAIERLERAPMLDRLKSAIKATFLGSERETTSNHEEETAMPVTDEQFKALSDEVKALSDGMKGIGETIANSISTALKPVIDKMAAEASAAEAAANAKKTELVGKIVKANLLPEPIANSLDIAALEALAETVKPKHSPSLNSALPSDNNDAGGFKLPQAE